MSTNFELAVEKTGRDYLQLELDLRGSAQLDAVEGESLRKAARSHPDPVARLVAKVVLDWAGPRGGDFKAALDYLALLPIKLAPTAMGTPSPMGTESYLSHHFADRVAELLALRLVKEEGWPHWKVVAIIFYLKEQKVPSTTAALIRLAIETPDPGWRGFALEAIREIDDRELGPKLTFEIARAHRSKRAVPSEVAALAP
jgi:hypothetical protein